MGPSLWSIRTDTAGTIIVLAASEREAREILTLLGDHGDLPDRTDAIEIRPCGRQEADTLLREARDLGVAGSFFARTGNGAFLTRLGRYRRKPPGRRLAGRLSRSRSHHPQESAA
ncbi:MAG: hypothetical protein F8N37_09525 [Telmatospirillum sp.]|nr:hypothetical protein [Telmatospirillum sp.]